MTMSELLTRSKFAVPVDREKVAKDWRERGYSCALFVDPPGQEWRDFVHNSNELVTVMEGRLEMIISDGSAIMEEGDEVLIPRGAGHSVINIHGGVSRWLFGYD